MEPASSPLPPRAGRQRRFWLLGIVAVSCIGGAAYWHVRSTRANEKQAAINLAERGPPNEAIPALKRFLERDPDDPKLLRAMVRAMTRAELYDTDIEPFTGRWCRAQPDDPEPWRARMDVTRQLDRSADSVEAAEHILALDPKDHKTRDALGRLYFSLGKFDDARRECLVLLETSRLPQTPLILSLGQIDLARGDLAEAAKSLDKALAQDPDHPEALIARGTVYAQSGEYARAIVVFRRVEPRTPDERVTLLNNLGQALTRADLPDQAEKVFDELTRVQTAIMFALDARHRPDDMAFQVRAARALMAADRTKEALGMLEKALANLRPDPSALEILADCYDRVGKPDLAVETREKASRLTQTPKPPGQ